MVENSYPWNGQLVGDAQASQLFSSPYSPRDMFSFAFARFIASNTCSDGVLAHYRSGMSGNLAITAGVNQVTVATGVAFVDGSVYVNNASLVIPIIFNGNYRLVIRKNYVARTVRSTLIGPIGDGTDTVFPGYSQQVSGHAIERVWDIPIARIRRTAGTVAIYADDRRFIRNIAFDNRKGGSASVWSTLGTTTYRVLAPSFQMGVAAITGTSTVVTFTETTVSPVVIVTVYGTNGSPSAVKWYISAVSSSSFTLTVDSVATADRFAWIVFGGE
jgi:hypothetical protein